MLLIKIAVFLHERFSASLLIVSNSILDGSGGLVDFVGHCSAFDCNSGTLVGARFGGAAGETALSRVEHAHKI